MARHEQDREDLLRDATALVERVEFTMAPESASAFVGFRRDGCASVYLDQDPVYHFNTVRELRRAYVDGRLYKAEKRCLVSMIRQRPDGEVHLVRHELSDKETARFLNTMRARLTRLADVLSSGSFTMIGQVPENIDVVGRARQWLVDLPHPVAIATNPGAF